MIVYNSPPFRQEFKNERESAGAADRFTIRFHWPDATAESDDSSVISTSENMSVPILARLEYFCL